MQFDVHIVYLVNWYKKVVIFGVFCHHLLIAAIWFCDRNLKNVDQNPNTKLSSNLQNNTRRSELFIDFMFNLGKTNLAPT